MVGYSRGWQISATWSPREIDAATENFLKMTIYNQLRDSSGNRSESFDHISILLEAVLLSANHWLCVKINENVQWKKADQQLNHYTDPVERLSFPLKKKKNQQWNPAVDWISIAQQADQF